MLLYAKKQLHTRVNRVFRVHIWYLFCGNILGAICGTVNSQMISCSTPIQYLINIIHVVLCLMMFANYMLYLLELLQVTDSRSKWYYSSMVPVYCLVVIAITSPFHHLFFKIENGTVENGVFQLVLIALICLYLMMTIILVLAYGKKITFRHRLTIVTIHICVCLGYLIQITVRPNFQVIYPLLTVLTFIYFMTTQNPDYYIDRMTGMYNRAGFQEVLRDRMGFYQPFYCLIVRINNYNSLLQVYQYDRLMSMRQELAWILLDRIKLGHLYRLSSSTFALVCSSEEQIPKLHEFLRETLPQRWEIKDDIININYSFYRFRYFGETDLKYENALQWINYARSDHKSHHEIGELIDLKYDTVSKVQEKQKVAHLVEKAIMDQSLEIYMQPVYSFEQDKIVSLEILSRMKDEDGKFINPEFFISVAEENHTIVPLGELIFRRSCMFASQNHIFDLGIEYMNINVSPGQCQFERLTERFIQIAKEYDIPMERIHLEITESEFQDPKAVETTLKKFREAGMLVALDDFGTGCSTMLSILEMPVDYVKIDKSLVWSYDKGDNNFLDNLMPIIKAEGKKVIAEGIETEEHIELLRRLGGDFLQGYYFSKPVPQQQFISYVKEFNAI